MCWPYVSIHNTLCVKLPTKIVKIMGPQRGQLVPGGPHIGPMSCWHLGTELWGSPMQLYWRYHSLILHPQYGKKTIVKTTVCYVLPSCLLCRDLLVYSSAIASLASRLCCRVFLPWWQRCRYASIRRTYICHQQRSLFTAVTYKVNKNSILLWTIYMYLNFG